jgi:hypothetical protein
MFKIGHAQEALNKFSQYPKMNLIYPRHYHTPPQFAPVKLHAITLCKGLCVTEQQIIEYRITDNYAVAEELANEAMVSRSIVDHGCQYFWLDKDLGSALLKTKPPAGISFGDVPYPFDAFTLMLPCGLFASESGEDIAFVSVAKVEGRLSDSKVLTPLPDRNSVSDGLFYTIHGFNDGPFKWFGAVKMSDLVGSTIPLLDDLILANGKSLPVNTEPGGALDSTITTILSLVVTCCFYMTQAADDVDKLTVGGKHKKGGVKREWYNVRWVGKRYATSRLHGGTHASPRTHWRCGHFRGVRFGEGRSEIKQMWIEPVLVNAIKNDSTSL